MIAKPYEYFVHNIDPIAFKIGFFIMPWYWLVYFLGYFFVYLGLEYLAKKNLSELTPKIIYLFMTRGFLIMLLSARLTYILLYNLNYYLLDPKKVFFIWEGGMSFHGALVGISISIFYYSKQFGLSFFSFSDPIAIFGPFVLGFGRIANFINGELAGRITTSKIGVIFPKFYDMNPRHPSQLYEAFFEGFIIFFILFLKRENLRVNGIQTVLFLLLYGVFRFCIEYFRMPDKQLGLLSFGLTMGQILCLIMVFVAGVIYLSKLRSKAS